MAELESKVAKLISLANLVPQTLELSLGGDVDEAFGKAKEAESALAEKVRARLQLNPSFTLFHAFEPNGKLTLAHATRYSTACRIVGECGGTYLLFIADVTASQRLAFGRDEAQIAQATDYALAVLRCLGVDGPHVRIVRSSELTLPNPDLFLSMIENSIKVSAKTVQDMLPPGGKKDVVTVSKMIAPCMRVSEILHLGVDFVLENMMDLPQMQLLEVFKPEASPAIISVPSVLNLKGAKNNPPKPDPKNVVFFDDEGPQIGQKANGAFCTDDIRENPVFQYICYVVISHFGGFEFGGKKYTNENADLAKEFRGFDKKELKGALATALEAIVGPVRTALAELPVRAGVAKMCTTVQ
jgi:tryptophanyl-tRNA synthetase